VLGAGIALAGCGTAPSEPPATASPSAPSGTPAAVFTPLPPGSFTVDLPDGWRDVPLDGRYEELVAGLRAANRPFGESLQSRLENVAETSTYFAFDASPEVVASGDLVTLVVTEVALPTDVSVQAFATTVQRQVEQLVEGDVELREVLVTAGQAYSLAYLAPLTRPDGQPASMAVTQVMYALPGRGYVISFFVPPARANDYAEVVATIATSFRIAN
jgi:hypothetical protein